MTDEMTKAGSWSPTTRCSRSRRRAEWAAKLPHLAYGPVEIRPLLESPLE